MIEDIESGKYKNNKEYPNYSYYKNLINYGIDRMDEYNLVYADLVDCFINTGQ